MCHIWTKGKIRFVSRVILFIINKLLTYQKPIFCKSNLMFAPQVWGLWAGLDFRVLLLLLTKNLAHKISIILIKNLPYPIYINLNYYMNYDTKFFDLISFFVSFRFINKLNRIFWAKFFVKSNNKTRSSRPGSRSEVPIHNFFFFEKYQNVGL